MKTASRAGLSVLLGVECLTELGTRVSQIAVPWLVLTQTGSATLAGLVGTAEIAPFVLMQLLGGPVVDRFGTRHMLLWANAIAGGCLALIPILHWSGSLPLGVVMTAVFVAGFCRGPADVAARVTLPKVCERSGTSIDRGAALTDGASRTALLIGAPVAGLLIGVWGAPATVSVAAVAMVLSAVVALWLPAGPEVAEFKATASVVRQLEEGLRYIAAHRLLRSICSMVLLSNLADAALTGLLLLLWVRSHGLEASRAGLLLAALGGAAAVGTGLVAVAGGRLPRRGTYAAAFLIAGSPRFAVLVLPVPFWAIVTVWAVSGMAAGAINPILAAAQYDTVPDALQARVLGAVTAVAWLGVPFGALLAGVVVDHLGLTTTLAIFALTYFVVTLDPFLRRSWSDLNTSERTVTPPADLGSTEKPPQP